jgi:hypothetical protein
MRLHVSTRCYNLRRAHSGILRHSDLRFVIKELRIICERNTVFVEDVTVAETVLGETHVAEGLAFKCLCRESRG